MSVLESNTADGQAWLTPGTGILDMFKGAGYTTVYPGPYNKGTEDYTSLISAFKKAGCEVHMGSNPGTDFPNFWKQAIQQSYKPKMAIEIVSISTYEDMKALGPIVAGLTLGFTWHKDWPFQRPDLRDDQCRAGRRLRGVAEYDVEQHDNPARPH